MRFVIEELALVAGIYNASVIQASHLTLATGHTVQECASNRCVCGKDRLNSVTLGLASDEGALVLITIGPLNLTLAVRDEFFRALRCVPAYLACEDGTISEYILLAHLTILHASHLRNVGEGVEGHIRITSAYQSSGKDGATSRLDS